MDRGERRENKKTVIGEGGDFNARTKEKGGRIKEGEMREN